MFTIRKKFAIEYAHILDSAFSSCCSDTIHGHSGIIEVFFGSGFLNDDGMVIDFGLIKEKIKPYIMSFDHALIISNKKNQELLKKRQADLHYFNKNLKIVQYNPTAENMAKDIYDNIKELMSDILNSHLWLIKVRFHETSSGWAEWSEEN